MNKKLRPLPRALVLGTPVLGLSTVAYAVLMSSTTQFFDSTSFNVTDTNVPGSTSASLDLGSTLVGQFNPDIGVLAATTLSVRSTRTQTISVSGTGNPSITRQASTNGSGTTSSLFLSDPFGNRLSFGSTSLSKACTAPTGFGTNCSDSASSSPLAANGALNINANLDGYVGSNMVTISRIGSASVTSTSPSPTAPGTAAFPSGRATATYNVRWTGDLTTTFTYLLHAAPSFDGSVSMVALDIDFGTMNLNDAVAPIAFSIFNLADPDRNGLDLDSIVGSGNTDQLFTDLGAFFDLAQDQHNDFQSFFDTSQSGRFRATYELGFSDADTTLATAALQNFTLTLNLTGNVIPEPTTLVLFGGGLAGFAIRRRYRASR